ncbi:MAG: hypothetical protein K2J77_02755 [Oscillospiraceae bacterium]|nr:hypothetical protein [Oscillospiraceae bacterium]
MRSNPKLLAAVLSVSLIGGCAAKSSGESSQTTSTSSRTEISAPTSEASSTPEESAPKGEPTFLIGLDGKAIYTGEITKLERTDKTAETLTEDDLYAEIYCEGFAYVKEPAAPYYNTYKNPELFADWEFLGGETANSNPWRRVNVGDEICGFKVKAAQTHFMTHDWDYNFPAKYYSASENFVELEGTAELEGFLQITAEAALYPGTGGSVEFYPCESKLPAMPGVNVEDNNIGYETDFSTKVVFNHTQIQLQSELDSLYLGKINEIDCDLDGLAQGDVAYARVTLGDINLFCGGTGTATLQKVELLSDILDHDDDETDPAHQPAPIRD